MGSRHDDIYQAASRYYVQGETMETIARDMMLSRSSISRLLKEARDNGLVRLSLADNEGSTSPVALALSRRFDVRVHLVTMRENANDSLRLEKVAKLAGQLLTDMVDDHQIIGVAWGTTVSRVVKHIARRPLVDARVVQMNGGANPRTFGIPYVGEILSAFAGAFDAEVVFFPVPAFFDQPVAKEVLWRERTVRNVLDMRARIDLAVFGVGGLQSRLLSHVYSAGYLDDAEVRELAAQGVVGDVCTVLLREDGSYQDIPFNQRATGPTPEELQLIPRRVCVVADPSRAAAVLGALRASVATDLVLDDGTARAVLDRLATAEPSGDARRGGDQSRR
ncbi:MAG: sugar-binding transcriptional regulator [Aeromicrobium sp.]